MAVLRFALRDLVRRWRASTSLAVLVALPLFGLVLVDGYVRSLDVGLGYSVPRLVVQQQGTVGQLAGSRIPAGVGAELLAAGVREAVPELHSVTGTTGADALLVVGVDPARYQEIDRYRLVSGRHLRAGDPERTVVLGTYLADRLRADPGDLVRIRGRDVRVVGVVDTGLYLDDAALLPLTDLQRLLGWGDDVSLFVIPADGPYRAGDQLPGGLEVVSRGDIALVDEWEPVVGMLRTTVQLLALGAVFVLATAVWRLAWLQRVELGLLRLLGFRRLTVAAYLMAQSAVTVVVGAVAGVGAAVVVGPRLSRTTLAVTTRPVIDAEVIARACVVGTGVLAVALAVPLVMQSRLSVRALLARDD